MIRPGRWLSATLCGAAVRAQAAEFEEGLPTFRNWEVSAMTNDNALFPFETSVRSHERI